ncbi:MAG: molybdopterin-dependent oxidoreductase, partial [Proteobacteria bacterium]|nr:molybdopterin-dependent oxidoreductase [Pseudomonadota bacterium]
AAHVILPIGSFAETAGTFVNCEGRWQSWNGAVKAVGESRPGWKVLRVLGNLLALPGFEYNSAEEVREAVHKLHAAADKPAAEGGAPKSLGAESSNHAESGWAPVPIYQVDALVRRSPSLSGTRAGLAAGAGA